ncbi:MAG: helix-turn-helix transcriptional regulator [Actinomycetales bacterium]|nr:helix-turn-helix transcriptional regulator [Actinomycetales bacterium]
MTVALPIVRSAALEGFAELARELGLDAPKLLREAGIHPSSLLNPETPLAAEAVGHVLEASARASGRADFGLLLAVRREFASLGPVSLVLKEQTSVGEALAALLRYLQLLNPSLVVRVTVNDERVTVQEDLCRDGAAGSAQAIELALGVMRCILRELLGPHWRPVSVHFRHAAPSHVARHTAFFGAPVTFRAGFNGLVLRTTDLAARPGGGDPALARVARGLLEQALKSGSGPDVIVRQLLIALLPSGRCTAQVVARHLGVDRRTLHRHLAAQGETFSQVLQAVRRELALSYVTQPQLPLAEVARLLGFAGASAFAYWFRSHFGCSVSQWRRRGEGSSTALPLHWPASAGAPVRTGRRTSE